MEGKGRTLTENKNVKYVECQIKKSKAGRMIWSGYVYLLI